MADIVNYGNDFDNTIAIIEKAKVRAIRAVNREMIDMYWQIAVIISVKRHRLTVGAKTPYRILPII